MIRKTLVTVALTAGMVAGSAGVASAHECFVAKRSAQGNAGATNSANWETLPLSHLYEGVHRFAQEQDPQGTGYRSLTPDEVTRALELSGPAGIPSSFTLFVKHTIPKSVDEFGAPDPKSGDGKGIDHFVAGYADDIIGVYKSIVFPPAEQS